MTTITNISLYIIWTLPPLVLKCMLDPNLRVGQEFLASAHFSFFPPKAEDPKKTKKTWQIYIQMVLSITLPHPSRSRAIRQREIQPQRPQAQQFYKKKMELERTYTNYVASQSQPHGQDYSINHHGNYPFAFVKYKQSHVSRQNTFILEVKENKILILENLLHSQKILTNHVSLQQQHQGSRIAAIYKTIRVKPYNFNRNRSGFSSSSRPSLSSS